MRTSHFDLHNASLEGASLKGAYLFDANLQEANFQNTTDLTVGNVKSARNWILAYYSKGMLLDLGLPIDHKERLAAKNFRQADLAKANLRGANLQDYDLRDSNLEESNLTDTVGLTSKISGRCQRIECIATGCFNAIRGKNDRRRAHTVYQKDIYGNASFLLLCVTYRFDYNRCPAPYQHSFGPDTYQ